MFLMNQSLRSSAFIIWDPQQHLVILALKKMTYKLSIVKFIFYAATLFTIRHFYSS